MPSTPATFSRASARDDAPTKERLLDAAERLIANGGIDGLSTRAVTQAAGLSVSAVNYHFGSKDQLLRAALRRALGPLGPERLERLEALEREGRLTVETLVEAFFRPAFEKRSQDDARSYRLLWGHLLLGTSAVAEELKHDLLDPSAPHFVDALCRLLPGRDRDELAFVFQLALGTALHALAQHPEALAGIDPLGDEETIARLVRFTAHGIRDGGP
ncbi:MAG: TetR/AcrR family transcriptional regulator [Myxococcota bacterium]